MCVKDSGNNGRIRKAINALLLLGFLMVGSPVLAATHHSFTTGKKTFLLDGKPFVVKAAEVHYPRIPRAYWDHRIKMCKALGMNTLCLYVFWNIHEQQPGVFDFTGNKDVAAFCRLAQKNGMYVIVRPGPYVCAEWEMGGLPWWLLKKKDIRLREQDPYFMERVRLFEKKVGEQLAPLTIDNGGPIIMVQVENEYGSYGEDKPYVSAIRDIVKESFRMENGNSQHPTPNTQHPILFQCDWASNFTKNGLDDLVWTMNFGTGSNIDDQFRRLGELRPDAPQMCSEFWSGWFDKWGARHETRPAKDMVAGIDEMLSKGISFSLYMTHGGTSFSHWAGANSPGYQPDVTSYDYDAPINEYGQPTEKYYQLREMMKKYGQMENGEWKKANLPAVPKSPMPFISVPKFQLTEFAPITNGIDSVAKGALMSFEDMNMGWGSMLYTTTLPEITEPSVLRGDFHDYAEVFIDGKYIGKIDRTRNEKTLKLPAVKADAKLCILVEGMGRINFGRAIKDYKGIVSDVLITTEKDGSEITIRPTQWENSTIPDDYETAQNSLSPTLNGLFTPFNSPVSRGTETRREGVLTSTAGYYRGYFNLTKVGDTFLNMEAFGKGQVYVNGHALGRFWSVGPQQTLYLPGCWLKKGRNEVIVLDVVGPNLQHPTPNTQHPIAFCQDKPELDKLNLEKSTKNNDPANRPDLSSKTPAIEGEFQQGSGWQTISLDHPVTGRYFAIECTSTFGSLPTGEGRGGASRTDIAELYLRDNNNNRIDRNNWEARYADSEKGNHTLDKMFDLQESTYWATEDKAPLPHLIVVDMGRIQTVTAIEYLFHAPNSAKGYKLWVY